MEKHVKEEKLTIALNNFADAMDSRLAEKEDQGYTGWDYEQFQIREAMYHDAKDVYFVGMDKDVELKKLVDIANRCMMLWHQIKQA